MTVSDLRHGMSSQEYLDWAIFYAREAQRRELAALKAGG